LEATAATIRVWLDSTPPIGTAVFAPRTIADVEYRPVDGRFASAPVTGGNRSVFSASNRSIAQDNSPADRTD
jgi:hypothetical protein